MSDLTLDGVGPMPIARPESAEELCELVRQARAEKQALFPLGGRTTLDLGLPPERAGMGIDLTDLDRVLDFPARDMTVTVEAGITVARLGEILAEENLRLPIDVPLPDQATLGGAIATNASGPRRLGFGTLRDYVIGITTINDEGQETKAGGRVVKNVAGYDLCKLHVGALGTLGIISQVTLKLRPIPEETSWLALGCGAEQVEALLDRIHSSRTRPVCVELLNRRAAEVLGLPSAPWVVVLGLEESAEAVAWQIGELKRDVSEIGCQDLTPIEDSIDAKLRDFPLHPEAKLSCKANLLPSRLTDYCQRDATGRAGSLLLAHAGNGIVIEHFLDEPTSNPVEELRAGAVAGEGNLILTRCPAEWKRSCPVWGARGDQALMAEVKRKLDPDRLFNPGRFVGEL